MFDSLPAPLPASPPADPLGVTGAKRLPILPDLPTLAEQGVVGVECISGGDLSGRRACRREIVAKLNAEIARALADRAQGHLCEVEHRALSWDA
jgi:tripartite-type tricarboxylate transporter receptor subunit TctC